MPFQLLLLWIHLLGLVLLSGGLFCSLLAFRRQSSLAECRLVQAGNAYFWGGSLVSTATGLAIWFSGVGGVPASAFTARPLLHVKLTLFVVLLLLASYPTWVVLSWRAYLRARQVPPLTDEQFVRVRLLQRLQLLLLAILPLLGLAL